nr:phage portal protein [Kibdelosporangium phytohabitans]
MIAENSFWPPLGHDRMRHRWQSWAAWWSGDLDELRTRTPCTAPGGYWARRAAKPGDREMHLPLAADIARTSAELVCGDTPVIEFEDDTATQKAWDDLAQTIGWANTLLEAGEISAALGGVYLRPVWDKNTAGHPLLTTVRADEALPEFRYGVLHSVTFVDELPAPDHWKRRKDAEAWRHLEHHERGQIRHELWLGTTSNTGQLLPLTEHPATEHLEPVIDTTSVRPDGGLLVDYVPNDLPQPLDRLPLGRSDLQGLETMLDALDEAWDSWMRDIELGKARVLLSKEMLDPVSQASSSGGKWGFGRRQNTTPAKAFDTDAKVFVPLDIPAEDAGKPAPITLVQFLIRVKEHYETCMALAEQITSRAGYSPQTMGMHVDGQLSGTAMRRRDHRSYRTRDRKRRYVRPAAERVPETLMLIGAAVFGGPKPKARPTLTWRETDQADPMETANVINTLRQARALSTEIAVQMAHPEWDKTQVGDEVKRLAKEDAALTAPPPTGHEPPVWAKPIQNQPPQPEPEPEPEDDDQ